MSVISYVRMRCSLEDAMVRYSQWIGVPEVSPAQVVRERDMIDLSLADGEYLGLAVFVYSSGPWTVFEEISGGLAVRSPESWLELAQNDELVYAGYNDTVPYAQIIVVQHGRVVRNFLQDEQDPSADVDVGQLPEEERKPFENWIDATYWVETDEEKLTRPDEGWLWIHESAY
jgi:hypothetical protein